MGLITKKFKVKDIFSYFFIELKYELEIIHCRLNISYVIATNW